MTKEIVLKYSRKAFFLEYLLAVIAITILLRISIKGQEMNGILVLLVGIAALVGLIKPELTRAKNVCIITQEAVTIKKGIFNKKEHQFHLSTITDVNYRQNVWQRLLKYGTLIIRSFSHAGKEIHVGNIDNPQKIMTQIGKLVEQKFEKPSPKSVEAK
jgi:uncharacterized membrane protein YdbT with pleckstrin-like domain